MIEEKEELELFNIAQIQGVYSDWSRTLPEGIHNINGRYYLAIPNGWEGRLWWYEWWVGHPYWDGEAKRSGISAGSTDGLNCNERDRDRYHKQHQLENEYIIHDKLIIDFGKATTYEDEDWTRELEATEVDVIFKIKIIASGTIKFNITKNQPNSPRKIIIDYGDGTTTENLTSTHTYSGNGPYTLICKIIQGSTLDRDLTIDTNNYWELPSKFIEVSNPNMIRCIAINRNSPYCLVPRPYILNFAGMNMPLLHLDHHGSMEKKERVMFRDCSITDVICWHKGREAYIWLSGNSSINTYHTATNIDTIYIVGQNRVSYSDNRDMGTAAEHYTNIKFPTIVYVHSDRPIHIYGYSYDSKFCDYAVPNIRFYVRNTIIDKMRELYPMLTFTGW